MNESNKLASTILFVDDEATAVKYFQRAIGALAPVLTAGSVDEGKRVLDEHGEQIAVLVSDQRMPGAYGNELLFYARDRHPHVVRILTTAYSELEHTVEAVNQGQIHRYIQKPWEITALRMELKQALELAALRRDHARLVRGKLQVGRRQLLANRVGMLHALCASLLGQAPLHGLDSYLAAACALGVMPPEPDWTRLDYADLVCAEAFRAAALREAVHVQLQRLEGEHADGAPLALMATMRAAFDASGSDDRFVLIDVGMPTQFLEAPTEVAPSNRHACWLACLLWLGQRGHRLQFELAGRALQAKLVKADAPLCSMQAPSQLAAWIEQI